MITKEKLKEIIEWNIERILILEWYTVFDEIYFNILIEKIIRSKYETGDKES